MTPRLAEDLQVLAAVADHGRGQVGPGPPTPTTPRSCPRCAGALGYLTKDTSAEQIEAAIRAVHAGQTHLDPAVQEHLVATVISRAPDPPEGGNYHQQLPAGLTWGAEVLALLAAGLSNPEIAQRLFVSNATVKTHINRIFAKTGSRDRAAAIGYAHRNHIA